MRSIAVKLTLVMIFMMPWEDAVTIGGFGSVTRAVGLVAAGFWALTALVEGRVRKLGVFHAAVFLFVIWNVLSLFWTQGMEETTIRMRTYIQLFILVLLIWNLLRTPGELRSGLQAYVLGCWVAIGSTIVNYLTGQESAPFSGGRYAATGVNPGDLALILVLGLPAAWFLATSAGPGRRSILTWLNYAYLPAAVFAAALTAARMVLFALAPAFLYVVATSTRFRFTAKALFFVALLGMTVVLVFLLPESAVERLATTQTSISSGDLGGRVAIWRTAVAEVTAHPVLGIGSGAFLSLDKFHSVVHNTYLSVLTETGIIGLILFLAVLLVALSQAARQPPAYARLWLAILASWAIGVCAQTWEHTKWTWLFLSLVIVSANLPLPPETALVARGER